MHPGECSSICRYYRADASFRRPGVSVFRKWCGVCGNYLVSRYKICPCCHTEFGGAAR